MVHVSARGLLWRGVGRRSIGLSDFSQFRVMDPFRVGCFIIEKFGQTKIQHLHQPVVRDHYVARFNIAMNDATGVGH